MMVSCTGRFKAGQLDSGVRPGTAKFSSFADPRCTASYTSNGEERVGAVLLTNRSLARCMENSSPFVHLFIHYPCLATGR